ncbi:MAG: hypothetical protein ACOZQL_06570 [Myxococcota bacterium]
MSRRLSELQLERYLADAMSADEKARVDAVLRASPEDAEALRLLRADSEAFLLKAPAAPFVEKVLPAKKRPLFGWLASLAAVAVAALALLLVWKPSPGGEDLGVKGTVGWKVTAGQRTLAPNGSVPGGETLSFVVTAAKPAWAAVISHAPDGWFVYVPATKLEPGQTLLPTGAKLDAQLGRETLHLVSSPQPFDADAVKTALAAGQPTAQLEVETLSFDKQ